MQAGLAELAKARAYAHATEADRWEFAVEMAQLSALGVTTSDLRWLVRSGYVETACESTDATSKTRVFSPNASLTFSNHTCFVLTEAGTSLLATLAPAPLPTGGREPSGYVGPDVLPAWDFQNRVLRVGSYVVKRYRRSSPNQEAVLGAFQSQGWPERIIDPLAPEGTLIPQKRLRDTISWLNRDRQQPVIRFMGDGTGIGVRWEYDPDIVQP
jgi:hypothetical protein